MFIVIELCDYLQVLTFVCTIVIAKALIHPGHLEVKHIEFELLDSFW